MFYISLPYFYNNFRFNEYFKNYIEESFRSKSNKLVANFNIEYAYGAFPWSYWNGGINNHSGNAVLTPDMKNIFAQTNIPLRLDMSNIYLVQEDYFDIHGNSILNMANGTNIIYEISNTDFMNYLTGKTLNNRFVISNNAQLIHQFNSEIINVFNEQENIELVNIGYNPFQQSHIILSDIKNKNKIEISIGHCQKCPFKKQQMCAKSEQKNIYNYSNQSYFSNCIFEYHPLNYYEEIQSYIKQGFTHFKIISNSTNLKDFNINLIKSFIKLEYQGECIDGYYRTISQ